MTVAAGDALRRLREAASVSKLAKIRAPFGASASARRRAPADHGNRPADNLRTDDAELAATMGL